MANENKLIKELRDILWKLSFYKGAQDHFLKKEPPVGNPLDAIKARVNLRVFLLDKIGKYRDLITELTGTDKATIHEFGKPRTVDMWTMGLRQDYDRRSTEALNDAIVNLSMAISKLEREIDEGYRDEQGNVIKKPQRVSTEPPKAFIAHEGETKALNKLKTFLDALGVKYLIAEIEPSNGRLVEPQVTCTYGDADFTIILATKGKLINKETGKPQMGTNVADELGRAREVFKNKIILLLETGVEAHTNISGIVHERFKPQSMDKAFTKIVKELRNWGFIITGKMEE